METHPIIIYDGICNLCNSSVGFILRHDTAARFRFAAFQSDAGQRLVTVCKSEESLGKTIILVQADKCHTRSDAILLILNLLPGAWSLLGGLRLIPRPIRDGIYNFIARNRYSWFGKRNICAVSLNGYEDRFLI